MKRVAIFMVMGSLTALLIFAGGCSIPVKMNGGGQLVAFDPGAGGIGAPVASLTVNADSCTFNEEAETIDDAFLVKGSITYIDRVNGVKMRGDIVNAQECRGGEVSFACQVCQSVLGEGSWLAYGVEVDYHSINPAIPDTDESQKAILCLIPPSRLAGQLLGLQFQEDFSNRPIGFSAVAVVGGPYDGYSSEGIMAGHFNVNQCF